MPDQNFYLSRPCVECGGERILADTLPNVVLTQYDRGLFAKSSHTVALVCTYCGHTTFYAKDPLALIIKRSDNQANSPEK